MRQALIAHSQAPSPLLDIGPSQKDWYVFEIGSIVHLFPKLYAHCPPLTATFPLTYLILVVLVVFEIGMYYFLLPPFDCHPQIAYNHFWICLIRY